MPHFPTPWHPDAPQAPSWLLDHALDLILSPIPSPAVVAGLAQSEKAPPVSEKWKALDGHWEYGGLDWTRLAHR